MDTPNAYFLSRLHYRPDKRQIVAEFSCNSKRQSRRFTFFPALFISKKFMGLERLRETISAYDPRKFKLEENTESSKITCSTYADAWNICALISKAAGRKPILMPPERQFLVANSWSYFDRFELSTEIPEKTGGFAFPETGIEGFIGSISSIFGEMRRLGTGAEILFLRKIVLSNALKVPLEDVSESRFSQAEILLENIYFSHGYLSHENADAGKAPDFSGKPETGTGAPKVVFGNVWRTLFTKSFFNVGPDSFKCGCCVPSSLAEKNMLPSSTVIVEFMADGIYYESKIDTWAREFHATQPGRKERERYARENFLHKEWVGPFFSGQNASIPIADARQLQETNLISGAWLPDNLLWFCMKNESALSATIIREEKEIKRISEISQNTRNISIIYNGLSFSSALEKDAEFSYFDILASEKSALLSQLPENILSPESGFYGPELAAAVMGIRESTMSLFRDFAEKKGFRPSEKKGEFSLSPGNHLLLTKSFSEQFSVPKPTIL